MRVRREPGLLRAACQLRGDRSETEPLRVSTAQRQRERTQGLGAIINVPESRQLHAGFSAYP